MTKEQAVELVNESLIDQDSKFKREINALFKQKEVQELMQQAYDMSDDNAKMSLMDATEKQFLDKFAKDGGSGDEDETDTSDTNSDFEEDGSDIDFETDGSDIDSESGSDNSEPAPADNGGEDAFGGEDSNPFADFGGEGTGDNGGDAAPAEPSNPFESKIFPNSSPKLNESHTPKRVKSGFHRKKK